MYLVVGGTGPVGLGGEMCQLLSASGRRTRALVRATSRAEQTEKLRRLGVELVEGDLRDRDSLRRACEGVRTVISTASMLVSRQPGDTVETVDGRGHLDLIESAKASGVQSFLCTSISGRIDRAFPFRDAKRDVERHLRPSGLSYTIFRPTFYMEVWLSPIGGFDYPNARKHARLAGAVSGELDDRSRLRALRSGRRRQRVMPNPCACCRPGHVVVAVVRAPTRDIAATRSIVDDGWRRGEHQRNSTDDNHTRPS